jgi:paired amphipathic helix protein Sin3a
MDESNAPVVRVAEDQEPAEREQQGEIAEAMAILRSLVDECTVDSLNGLQGDASAQKAFDQVKDMVGAHTSIVQLASCMRLVDLTTQVEDLKKEVRKLKGEKQSAIDSSAQSASTADTKPGVVRLAEVHQDRADAFELSISDMAGSNVAKIWGHPAMTGKEVKGAIEQLGSVPVIAMQLYNPAESSEIPDGDPLSEHGIPSQTTELQVMYAPLEIAQYAPRDPWILEEARELKVEDALQYLDQVKAQFSDQPTIYNQFLDIMKNFKAQTIDTPGVIKGVATLFKGHDNLILGFNTFLPQGFKIKPENIRSHQISYGNILAEPAPAPEPVVETAPETGQQPIEFDHAINYVERVKKRFNDDTATYKKFLQILHMYKKEERSIDTVLEELSTLFEDHPDLLSEFTHFLPDKPT